MVMRSETPYTQRALYYSSASRGCIIHIASMTSYFAALLCPGLRRRQDRTHASF